MGGRGEGCLPSGMNAQVIARRGLGVMFASRHPITDYEDKWWGDEFLEGIKDVTIKLEMGDAQ